MALGVAQTQKTVQKTVLSQQAQQGLTMLAMSLPELRTELLRQMAENPMIDDVEPTLEKATVSQKERETVAAEERPSDYPEDDVPDASYTADAEALERRQKFFDSQVATETLADHLLAQLAVSDIAPADRPLAETLIGELDGNGYFQGSLPDVMMVSGESEEKIRAVLKQITELDPAGCGATTLAECLAAQLGDIADPVVRERSRRIVNHHLEDLGAGRFAEIAAALGIAEADVAACRTAIRSLQPRPGSAFRNAVRGDEYIHPEIHAVKGADGWVASVDARSLPEIHISPRYLTLLADPNASAETKAYVRERIAAANAIVEAVKHREETITGIAQAIFDAQPDFFEQGLKGLRPLTMQQVADRVGVVVSTVSRTVNGKYASTPRGTVELRRFFTQGVATASGEVIARDRVKDRLRELVEAEDRAKPLSDDRLTELLNREGFPVKRRTTAKYREELGLPTASKRKAGGAA